MIKFTEQINQIKDDKERVDLVLGYGWAAECKKCGKTGWSNDPEELSSQLLKQNWKLDRENTLCPEHNKQ